MKLKGSVSTILFSNPTNGYTVLSLKEESGENVTVVGYFPVLSAGETLEVEGEVSSHPKYGEQFVAKEFSVQKPNSKENVVKYLASGLIRGVGEKTAQNIYDKFGEKTMDVIENAPLSLAKIKGISQNKAISIAQSVGELKKMQNAIMYLQKYGITPNTAVKIYNVYKDETIGIIDTNPYKLIDDVDGIGFVTADKIALSSGQKTDGEFRLRAGIVYVLNEAAEKQGETYLPQDELVKKAADILQLDIADLDKTLFNVLSKLALEPTVKLWTTDGEQRVALIKNYAAEKAIAAKLTKLNRDARRISTNADTLIDEFQITHKINFDAKQRAAVVSSVTNGVSVITGGPGTGKTTIIQCVAHIFKTNGLRLALCAPTGRAAKRMEQSVGLEAKTIHRLLGAEFTTGRMHFCYNKNNTLPFDVIVVDEMSMTDIYIFSALLSAVESGSRLILVGDKDQLPSVGAGNVLRDIIQSKTVETRYLDTIYRQSEDSLIVSNAHLINSGKMPEINNQSKDFFFISCEPPFAAQTVCDLVEKRLPKFSGVPSMEIQTMAALKSGAAGVENLNASLQQRLNPASFGKKQVVSGRFVFREGDRVMQTSNNYSTPWLRYFPDGTTEEGEGVFNGDIGFVLLIDAASATMKVRFDDRVVTYNFFDLPDLQLAYAVTVHKSQGSEFDVVVISLAGGPPTIINRNLLYTAITRAKRAVVIVGGMKVLAMMVHNNFIAGRRTMLKEFLLEEKANYDKFFS